MSWRQRSGYRRQGSGEGRNLSAHPFAEDAGFTGQDYPEWKERNRTDLAVAVELLTHLLGAVNFGRCVSNSLFPPTAAPHAKQCPLILLMRSKRTRSIRVSGHSSTM